MIRSEKGSEIIEGAVALIVVISGWVIGGLMVLDAAAIGYYQNKISLVAQQGAQYASQHFYDPTDVLQMETSQYVQNLMQTENIPMGTSFNVTLTEGMVGNQSKGSWQIAETINVQTDVPLFGSLAALPFHIQLQDSEVSLLSEEPAGYAYFPAGDIYNAPVGVVVPITYQGDWAGLVPVPMTIMDALKGSGGVNGKPLLATDGAAWFDGGFIVSTYGPGNQLSGFKGVNNSVLP
jgi:hypothetical protein